MRSVFIVTEKLLVAMRRAASSGLTMNTLRMRGYRPPIKRGPPTTRELRVPEPQLAEAAR